MSYGNVHRYFLRNLMSKGVFTEREAKRVLQRCSDDHNELSVIITEINSKIRPLSQEIKLVRHEITGEYHVTIIWTGLGDAALGQGLYSQNDVLYWRKLMEEIAVNDRKRIGAIEALNLSSGMNITKIRAQDLMNEWTTASFLEKIDDGFYILGIRGMHEFESYLRLNLPETLDVCTLCTKTIFQSKQCDYCGHCFHNFCLATAREKMKVWPCCKNVYREEEPMDGENPAEFINNRSFENVDTSQNSSNNASQEY